MEQKNKKVERPQVRAFGKIDIKNINVEDRTVEFTISDETRDRDGTIIFINAWRLENYAKNPIVCYMHDTGDRWNKSPDPDVVIGHAVEVRVENGELIGVAKFDRAEEEKNELADKVFRKLVRKTLRAVSVGFWPMDGHWGDIEDGEDSGTYYFTDVELMEFSVVALPSNPNAVARNYEGKIDAFKSFQKSTEDTQEETTEETEETNHGQLYGHRLRILSL